MSKASYKRTPASGAKAGGPSGSSSSRSRATEMAAADRGGYCGALQRTPPALPPGLAKRLANKEIFGLGKVKVMLRISGEEVVHPRCISVDKKRRQVTLSDPTSCASLSAAQDRGPMVAAPKMFAFDSLFAADDAQIDVCTSALSEVIPAVIEGSDGILISLGYPGQGQTNTMLGSISTTGELGAIPCAISWLYKSINDRRQKSGARFSVRVSALGVCSTKSGSATKDLLAAQATESDESPGMYLRDDFLGGPSELRAPTAERAGLFLDAALAGLPSGTLDSAFIFTLHVYQYSLAGKGGVAGGRSRLHLIDLGGCANRNGGLPLSGIGNVLLAILSGQRHTPNRDHALTPILRDCLASLTCHVSVLAHVTFSQTYTDALTTIQLASRIHRMRRRKHRFPMQPDKQLGVNNSGPQSGSSEGPDPSSSDLSADTVIYVGPIDDATDGEHPPVYIPSLSSGDNRCVMSKALKGSGVEKPSKVLNKKPVVKAMTPTTSQRPDTSKPIPKMNPSPSLTVIQVPTKNLIAHQYALKMAAAANPVSIACSSSRIVRSSGLSRGSSVSSSKGTPHRVESPMRQMSEEQWVDGPRVSKSKVAEARHLLREINNGKQCERWVDGPKRTDAKTHQSAAHTTPAVLPMTTQLGGYGFMDNHKKTMIRKWVENQSSQIYQGTQAGSPSHAAVATSAAQQIAQSHPHNVESIMQTTETDIIASTFQGGSVVDQVVSAITIASKTIQASPVGSDSSTTFGPKKAGTPQSDQRSQKSKERGSEEDEDQDSGPSEVPPALPLIEPLGSRDIPHESLQRICSRHMSRESLAQGSQTVQTMECGLQVTEEEIARTMGSIHPFSTMSNGNLSAASSFQVGDTFSDCVLGNAGGHQFDQLARLREIFTSQLAMAEVTPAYRINDAGSVFSEPVFRFTTGSGSVYSEPAYRPPSPMCRGCRQSLSLDRSPSQTSLPSLDGIMTIAGMEQYASLRHPDGASDTNLQNIGKTFLNEIDENTELLPSATKEQSCPEFTPKKYRSESAVALTRTQSPQLPLLPLSTSEAYDSGHDSSTPRTSKHSGISRRAESGYHSVATTARDSDESSFGSMPSRAHKITAKKRNRQDKSLCNWLRNPFTCTYPDTEGEVSDF